MKRLVIPVLVAAAALAGGFYLFLNLYWIHRYDALIARQAGIYRLDPDLVWSIIYEETYFQPWKVGADGEIGLMQVTPTVAREWARETGLKDYERQANEHVNEFLSDPERNIQAGCWYLELLRERYRGHLAETAMTLAAYNAGASRVEEWTRGHDAATMSESQFVENIGFPSTKAYVTSILGRYRKAAATP